MAVTLDWTTGGEEGFGPTYGAVTSGQLLLLFAIGDPSFVSGSSGWELLADGEIDPGMPPFVPSRSLLIWQKIAGASETPPVLNSAHSWLVMAFSGYDPSASRTSGFGTYQSSSTLFPAPSIGINAPGTALHVLASHTFYAFSPPSGESLIASGVGSGGVPQILVSSAESSSSMTPSGTWTSTTSAKGRAITIGIPALANVTGGGGGLGLLSKSFGTPSWVKSYPQYFHSKHTHNRAFR